MERSEHWLEYVKISELIKASNKKGKENVSTVWNFPSLFPPIHSFLSGCEVVKLCTFIGRGRAWAVGPHPLSNLISGRLEGGPFCALTRFSEEEKEGELLSVVIVFKVHMLELSIINIIVK